MHVCDLKPSFWLVLVSGIFVTGCSLDFSSSEIGEVFSISGKISGFSSPSSFSSSESICDENEVQLFSLDEKGNKETLLGSTQIDANGQYSFNQSNSTGLQLDKISTLNYLVEFNCGTATLERFVTGEKDQDLSESLTILGWARQLGLSTIGKINSDNIAKIYRSLSSNGSSTDAYSTLTSDSALSSQFENSFGFSPNLLMSAPPKIRTLNAPNKIPENVDQSYSAQLVHWSASYKTAISWKLDGIEISNSNNFTFTPTPNSQGTHLLQIFYGSDDGTGQLDTQKPYQQKVIDLVVVDTLPAKPPSLNLTSASVTNSLGVTLSITTGNLVDGIPEFCQTFSKLALTEEAYNSPKVVPKMASSYNIECTQTGIQNIALNLSGSYGERRFSLWAMDSNGQKSQISSSVKVTFDNNAPSISSFTISDGNAYTAFRDNNYSISVSEDFPANMEIRVSEDIAFSGATYEPFSGEGEFLFSLGNGAKILYAQVKDAAGNTSLASSDSINMDFGVPPILSVSAPTSGSVFSTNDPVTISWTCQSPLGLASPAITKIQYTTNEGVSFQDVASNLPNNIDPNNGQYVWNLPASLNGVSFKFMVSCKAASGVVATAFSDYANTPNWRVYMGDPWYGKEEVGLPIAELGNTDRRATITEDNLGHVFYVRNNEIYRIDKNTALVTRFAGVPNTTSCTATNGSNLFTTPLNGPYLMGTTPDRQHLLVLNNSCKQILKIKASDGSVEVLNTLPTGTDRWFLTANKTLVYLFGSQLYRVDLNSSNQPVIHIFGNNTCGAIAANGTDARLSPGWIDPYGACNQQWTLFANEDASRVYFNNYHSTNLVRIDYNSGLGHYVIGNSDMGVNLSNYQGCHAVLFENAALCPDRHAGRGMLFYDFATETSRGDSFPMDNNESGGFLGLGVGDEKVYGIYSLNVMRSFKPKLVGDWNFIYMAGQSLFDMGNGNDLSKVALYSPNHIRYNSNAQKLLILGFGHFRQVDYSTSPVTISTISASLSTSSAGMAFNRSGDQLIHSRVCGPRTYILSYDVNDFLNQLVAFTTGGCNNSPGSHIMTSGVPVAGGTFLSGVPIQHQTSLLHSNGIAYFYAENTSNQDAFIYSSDGVTFNIISGLTGAQGYNGAHEGVSASTATLEDVYHLFEDANGDILFVESNRIRKITITTESADPQISTFIDFSTISGFPLNQDLRDFIYNESNGWMYFATAAGNVYKAKSGVGATQYDFTGTTLSGVVRLALTPDGLLVLQPDLSRILRVDP